MDDTGFFSVQVLENALGIWGSRLIRWRSEELRPFQANPELQVAFILNLEQHWFTIRRFGSPENNFHWFNLNSFLKEPELVSSTYLGMVLQQAEQEGYSVFAVRPGTEDNSASHLPEVDADQVASTIPPSSSFSETNRLSTSKVAHEDSKETELGDFADEDLELQQALQASLLGAGSSNVDNPAFSIPPTNPLSTAQHSEIEASRARQKAALDRARIEQEMATREIIDSSESLPVRPRHGRTGAEEEEEMLRKAMEDSLAEIEAAKAASTSNPQNEVGDQPPALLERPPAVQRPLYPTNTHPRVLDDEDEELQAALRASLADAPSEFVMPPSPRRVTRPSAPEAVDENPDNSTIESQPSSPVVENISMEEMRRRRLERFGS
ncbi:hypothetical protein FRC02_001022 [Tulasnella sp. 418]|nr:hypothetical protein FRC02_001022 [Tulasnella sp. 418]